MNSRNRPSLLAVIIAAVVAGIAIAAAFIALSQSSHINRLSATNQSLTRQLTTTDQQIASLRAEQSALSAAEQARQSANAASLGVCEQTQTETLDNYSPPVTVVIGISISSPSLTNGVASCPFGSFIPVAPQSAPGA